MGIIRDHFYRQEPMKYYQPLDYTKQAAIDIIQNKGNNYIAEQKFDGEWARAIIEDGTVIIQSRNISKVTGEYGDKTALVPHIVEELLKFPDGTVLLGELCFDDPSKTARDVGTILRCKPDKAIQRQATNKLVFRMFDCLAVSGYIIEQIAYESRLQELLAAVDTVSQTNVIEYCKQPNYVTENFEDFLQLVLSVGGEGIVIHNRNYSYAPGARPAWTTLKVKRITTELELPVVETIAPKRHYEGEDPDSWKYWIGTYTDNGETVYLQHAPGNIDMEACLKWEPVTKPYYYNWKNGVVVNNNGTLVRVTSGCTDEDREWLAADDAAEAIEHGQLFAVVSAMEVTPDGSLRHPRLLRLRLDKE